jgi:hypothetical protein
LNDALDIDTIRLIRLTGTREEKIRRAREEKGKNWNDIQRIVAYHNKILNLGEAHTRQKAIQDPIHGAILLEPWELDIISSWEMLRLRYVKQLGPAHIVYPGATHTRFEHCIGTSFLAQKCVRVVNYCEDLDEACFVPLSRLLEPYHQKLFRIAALLHDVGHPPTSHTIEFALENWAGLSHTDLGKFLIMNSGLTDVLRENDVEPEVLVSILKGNTKDPVLALLTDFLDSPLDLDKTDYLIRDAHFSGVDLGIFPAERVLLTNRVIKNEGAYRRAFMLKALHSLESLVLSRSWMFADLYLHHAVRVAEALTSKATYYRMKEEALTRNECIGLFTRMTDADLYNWLGESDIDFVKEYAARIRYRRLFKVVTARPIASFDENTREFLLSTLHDIDALTKVEVELVDDVGQVIVDVVNPILGEDFLRNIPILVGGTRGFDVVPLSETEEGRPLLQALRQQKRTIPAVRIYSDPSIAAEVRSKFDKEFPSEQQPPYREDDYGFTDY